MELIAYEVSDESLPLETAPRRRQWMEDTPDRFAYRCLPLVMANQMGWNVLCPDDFAAIWDGTPEKSGIEFEYPKWPCAAVQSHFGEGILTFTLGYLVRTPPGHNLWCKGPANDPKDGIAPLEGVIETDWTPATFTMNWKFTRAHHRVEFRRGEPVCTLIPFPRGYLAGFRPVIRPIASDPELHRKHVAWSRSRSSFLRESRQPDSDAQREGWQKDYMLGRDPDDRWFEGHETKLTLHEFRRDP